MHTSVVGAGIPRARVPALHELLKLFRELHHFALRPAPIVGGIAIAFADEGTMAAVFGFDVSDVAIGEQRLRASPAKCE